MEVRDRANVPISSTELDEVREQSPLLSKQVAWWNDQLRASAQAGANPAWASSFYREQTIRNEVAQRFRDAGFEVRTAYSQGVADLEYGVRHHLTIVQGKRR